MQIGLEEMVNNFIGGVCQLCCGNKEREMVTVQT